MRAAVLLLALLAGCAAQPAIEDPVLVIPAQRWWKTGTTFDEVKLSAAQCRESAFAVPNVTYTHRRVLYEACMEGRGFSLRE